MSKIIVLTIALDTDQFEEEGAVEFFAGSGLVKGVLAGERAAVHVDGYSFSGTVTAAAAR